MIREQVNTAIGITSTNAVAGAVDGTQESPADFAFDALASGLGAGLRQTSFDALGKFGKGLAYAGQRDGALSVERYLAQYPASWTAYSVYAVVKDAIRHAVLSGSTAPTELDPQQPTTHGEEQSK